MEFKKSFRKLLECAIKDTTYTEVKIVIKQQ